MSLTPTAAVLASIGLFVRPRRPGGHVFHYWLIGVLLFLVTVARHPHQWYSLALVPVAAALAGSALDRLADLLARAWGRGPAICAGLVLYLSLGFSAYMQVAPLYQPWALPAFKAGVALRQLAPGDALVAVVDAGDPTAIYYSGRKVGRAVTTSYCRVPETEDYVIFDLSRTPDHASVPMTGGAHTLE